MSWGTPGRSGHYVQPRPKWAFLRPALAAASALLGVILLLHVFGWRDPVSPGKLISQHASFESRCQECHTPRRGVSDARCQRCHDPSGAGRLTNAAHVLFGSGDARAAAAAPVVPCARCHVEHGGRAARLGVVDQRHCSSCHFRRLAAHPEFAVLRAATLETPGIEFPHERHVQEFAKQGVSTWDSCLRCHEPSGRDLVAIDFDRHCASCHAKDGSVGQTDPVAQDQLASPELVAASSARVNFSLDEFDTSRGRLTKTFVRHRDDWVLFNLRKLFRELDPEGWAAERGALVARQSQLERRLALATPLAELSAEELEARAAALEAEARGLETRLGRLTAAEGVEAGLRRLAEVADAAAAAGDEPARAEAERLREQAGAGAGAEAAASAPLPPDEHEARRRELLALLDAVEAQDVALKPRAEDLRRRLLALTPGEAGAETLARVLDQRRAELARVRDEIALRAEGISPPTAALLVSEQRALREALAETAARLAELSAARGSDLGPEERERRQDAFEVLTASCRKCHVASGARLRPVRAARPVLVRSTFVHAPHLLQADCARCHAGVEASRKAADLNFRGVESCRECHRPRGVRDACQTCHRYHPRALP